MVEIFRVPLFEGAFVLILFVVFAVRYDVARFKQLKYGRRLRGPILVTPTEFNKTLKGDGMGIQTDRKGTVLKLPLRAEAKHIQIMGDTGTGKSTLLMQMLQQIELRGESAIVYDPAGEFTERFYSPKRGDWILNPLDARSPYWTPASELRNPAEARTIATSLYQPTNDKKGEFFTETPQKIFAHLLKYRPSPQELVAWMSNEDEIDRRVEGTELAQMIAKGAQQQRSGVLGSLGLIADSLRLLPTKTVTDGKRQGKSFMMDRQIEPLVMSSEIEGLDDLHSFVKLGNYVSRFSFPPMELSKIAEGFELRPVAESDLWFDPLHPKTADAGAAPGPASYRCGLARNTERNR